MESTSAELKARLQQIANDDYRLPEGVEPWPLVEQMMANLGSPDPVLRDDLIYTTLFEWSEMVLQPAELRRVLEITLDDRHLFYQLGEQGTDSVFMRAFSLLAAAIVIYRHRSQPCLPPELVEQTLDRVLTYFPREVDLRGYTPEKGWAHAIAHAADLFDELAQAEELREEHLHAILNAIRDKLLSAEVVFAAEEDERLAVAVISVLRRGLLSEEQIRNWLQSFPPAKRAERVVDLFQMANRKNFLRSLYFQMQYKGVGEALLPGVAGAVKAASRFK